ncbi:hypothetical protein HY633_04290 [Candidatus Uhrbacteria bacterium]|nr:hypothetical protein [Candidatus Uhrbacteria bacterium]
MLSKTPEINANIDTPPTKAAPARAARKVLKNSRASGGIGRTDGLLTRHTDDEHGAAELAGISEVTSMTDSFPGKI